MKNPILDAIKNMKAKRVAIVVGDADEMGLPDMAQLPGDMPEMEDEEMPEEEMQEGEDEAAEGEQELAGDEEPEEEETPESMMGRKPFAKGAAPSSSGDEVGGGQMSEKLAKELHDEDYTNRLKSSGRKPNGLFARAQMNLANRFGKK